MEFWKEVRQRVLTGEISQRAALRQYGLGWHTLRKILTHDAPPGYRQQQPRQKRVLAPFLPVIQQILEDDRNPTFRLTISGTCMEQSLDTDIVNPVGRAAGMAILRDVPRRCSKGLNPHEH